MNGAETERLYAALPAAKAVGAGDRVLVQNNEGLIREGAVVRFEDDPRPGWHPVVVRLDDFAYTWRVPLDRVRVMVTTPEPGNSGGAL